MDCSSKTDIPDPTTPLRSGHLSPNTLSSLLPAWVRSNMRFHQCNGGYVITYHDAAYGRSHQGLLRRRSRVRRGKPLRLHSRYRAFGFNLRANTTPAVGFDPEAAVWSPTDQPRLLHRRPLSYDDTGSAVILAAKATSNAAARYTLSYLANISAVTRAAVYKAHQVFRD